MAFPDSCLSRLALRARDALVLEQLPLADAIASAAARRLFPLAQREDLIQVGREALLRSASRCRAGEPNELYLRGYITGALQNHLRDRVRLVRISRREHEKGIHPWGHQSLDAQGPDERPYHDHLASPESEAPVFEGSEAAAEALLERLPANEAPILRLRVQEGQSLRSIAAELGISAISVSHHEKAALALLLDQLA
jgi:RNA polymerase sigma factor (sigma-70 family)